MISARGATGAPVYDVVGVHVGEHAEQRARHVERDKALRVLVRVGDGLVEHVALVHILLNWGGSEPGARCRGVLAASAWPSARPHPCVHRTCMPIPPRCRRLGTHRLCSTPYRDRHPVPSRPRCATSPGPLKPEHPPCPPLIHPSPPAHRCRCSHHTPSCPCSAPAPSAAASRQSPARAARRAPAWASSCLRCRRTGATWVTPPAALTCTRAAGTPCVASGTPVLHATAAALPPGANLQATPGPPARAPRRGAP